MSSRKLIEDRRQKKKRKNTLLVIMMGAGLILVVAAIVIAVISTSKVNLSQRNITIPEFTENIPSDFNGLGDPEAPVVIEEFSDFGCTFCADFALETKKLLEDDYIQTGQVYLVFHSVGGMLQSSATFQAAEAAYCAGDQDALWSFHDLIFANQASLFSNRNGDISKTMTTFAEVLELDLDQFNSCLLDRKYQELTLADEKLARENDISGTPSFLINGVLYRGNQPFESFQQAIAEALAAGQ
jgi:protein-disulfide isomerase